MSGAVKDAGVEPDCVLIDGNPMHIHPKEKTLVKGDARIAAIAAASIVAKVTRDHLMVSYDEEYPEYHFAECKGYARAYPHPQVLFLWELLGDSFAVLS